MDLCDHPFEIYLLRLLFSSNQKIFSAGFLVWGLFLS